MKPHRFCGGQQLPFKLKSSLAISSIYHVLSNRSSIMLIQSTTQSIQTKGNSRRRRATDRHMHQNQTTKQCLLQDLFRTIPNTMSSIQNQKRRKRVCLFGTSADPPTGKGGHLGIAQHLASSSSMVDDDYDYDFDEVRILPVYQHMFGVSLCIF